MINSFDENVAADVGVIAAVIYKNIQFWCEHNRTNGINEKDGLYWTYNTITAFDKQFKYLTRKQIRSALDLLEEKGYIKTGNFNKTTYDRTKWYADIRVNAEEQKGNSICLVGQMEGAKKANGSAKEGKAIPDINTDIETNVNTTPPIIPREDAVRKELFEQFWKAYPNCKRKVDKKGCERKFIKIENLEQIFPDIMASLEMWKKSSQWTKDNGEYIPLTSKWINQEYWTVRDERTERQTIADDLMSSLGDIFRQGE